MATVRWRIERHIKPLLGRKKVQDVSRADVKRFLQDVANGKTAADVKTGKRGRAIVRGGQGAAIRTVGLLGGIFAYAVDCGMIEASPVIGIKRFADKKGKRYPSQQELVALGEVKQLATSSPQPCLDWKATILSAWREMARFESRQDKRNDVNL